MSGIRSTLLDTPRLSILTWFYIINKNKKINGNYSGIHGVALNSTVSRSNWNLEMLVFAEGGKPENPEKNARSRDENQQQTQPTYDTESRNRTRATLVGGECSHHCAIPAPTLVCVTKNCLESLQKGTRTRALQIRVRVRDWV